jgi:hypothetical protein
MMRKMMREGKGWTDGSQESVVECFTPMQPGDESLTPPLLLGGEKNQDISVFSVWVR